MADVQNYDDLPYTQFPVDVDTFEDMQDVSLDTYGWVKQYNEYFASGNIKSAQAVLAAHPELQKCIFNALKINRMTQAIKAMERFYKEDMTGVIEAAAKNAIGINDNATEEESKVTGYSGYKIENLLREVKYATLPLSGWVGDEAPWTQTIDVEGTKATDTSLILWNNTTDDLSVKKKEQKSWNMVDDCEIGNGTITFTCKFKKPIIDIPIAIKGR